MKNKPEMIIFCGCQGAGKTTFYKKKLSDSHLHICLDNLRCEYSQDVLIDNLLKIKKSFVIDNLNITKKIRKKYIELARQNGFDVFCYYFKTDIDNALRRNNGRKNSISPSVVRSTHNNIQEPDISEGFSNIFVVCCSSDKNYTIYDTQKKISQREITNFILYLNKKIDLFYIIDKKLNNKDKNSVKSVVLNDVSDDMKKAYISIEGRGEEANAEILNKIKEELYLYAEKRENFILDFYLYNCWRFKNIKEKIKDIQGDLDVFVSNYKENNFYLWKNVKFTINSTNLSHINIFKININKYFKK